MPLNMPGIQGAGEAGIPRRSPRLQPLKSSPNAAPAMSGGRFNKAASGALFAGQATTQTMKRAHGYMHFRLEKRSNVARLPIGATRTPL